MDEKRVVSHTSLESRAVVVLGGCSEPDLALVDQVETVVGSIVERRTSLVTNPFLPNRFSS